MDIGSGDGKIFYLNLLELQRAMPKATIFSYYCDIEDYISPNLHSEYPEFAATFIQADNFSDYEYFNLITCRLSLHHIDDSGTLIQKLHANYIFIREHDINTKDDFEIVSVEHFIYSLIENDCEGDVNDLFEEYKFQNPRRNYKSAKQWRKLFKYAGYSSVWSSPVKGPTRVYSELFRSNK
jgi:hypothetical protein